MSLDTILSLAKTTATGAHILTTNIALGIGLSLATPTFQRIKPDNINYFLSAISFVGCGISIGFVATEYETIYPIYALLTTNALSALYETTIPENTTPSS